MSKIIKSVKKRLQKGKSSGLISASQQKLLSESIRNNDSKMLTILIQYCGGWGYAEYFFSLKDYLEKEFKQLIEVQEQQDDVVTGNFEVTIVETDRLIHSKQGGDGIGDTVQEKKAIVEQIIDDITSSSLISASQQKLLTETIQMCDSKMLTVLIQYCGGWGYAEFSDSLRDYLEKEFKQLIEVQEQADDVVTGNFEVTIVEIDKLIHSKQGGGGFGDTAQERKAIVEQIIDQIKL